MTAAVEIRGTTYEIEQYMLDAMVAAFDLWRDGLGKFAGVLGRAAFLRGTSDIVGRFVAADPHDPYKRERHLRVLRHVLASRPRSTKPTPRIVLP